MAKQLPRNLGRRSLLKTVAGTSLASMGGALIGSGFLGLKHAQADITNKDEAPLLVMCEFVSGWDTLYSLDPRDNTQFNDPSGGIQTGWDW